MREELCLLPVSRFNAYAPLGHEGISIYLIVLHQTHREWKIPRTLKIPSQGGCGGRDYLGLGGGGRGPES